ncbi:TraR/DksA family transcriptional regulator [Salinimicrobium sp. CDJ15-81-2]|nr:TraR/DksA family transcriptional regulator [Salinimicrobium nanhaiense]
MDKAEFKQRVIDQIEKQEKSVILYRSMSNPVSPDNAIGRVSRMDAINNKSVVDAALRKAEERLQKLKSILERLDDPDFGKCRKCKQPIPEGRLLIMPESSLCVRCAS